MVVWWLVLCVVVSATPVSRQPTTEIGFFAWPKKGPTELRFLHLSFNFCLQATVPYQRSESISSQMQKVCPLKEHKSIKPALMRNGAFSMSRQRPHMLCFFSALFKGRVLARHHAQSINNPRTADESRVRNEWMDRPFQKRTKTKKVDLCAGQCEGILRIDICVGRCGDFPR